MLRSGIILLIAFQLPASAIVESSNEIIFDGKTVNSQIIQQEIRELKPGETVERQAKPNEIHGYRITLQAGTAVEINVGKRDISTQLTAKIPDSKDYTVPGNKIPEGKELARVIAGTGDVLVEPMVIIAEETGDYILTAQFLTPGTYSFSIGLAHPITERDRKYAAAGKLFAEIRQSVEKGESWWKLREKVEERAAIYRNLGDKKSLALSLNDVGRIYQSSAEFGKAVGAFKEALELFRSLNNASNMLENLSLIGGSAIRLGDYQTAIDSYNEGVLLSRSIGNKSGEAGALHSLGVGYHLLADEQKALDCYEQSLAIKKTLPPDPINGEPLTLINIGNIYRGVEANEIVVEAFGQRTTADRQKALEYYKQALEIAREFKKSNPGARTRESYHLLQIGNTYKELGNYSEALIYLNQSLENYKNSPGLVYVLLGLGNLFVLKGDYQKGFEYLEQVTALVRSQTDNHNQSQYFKIIAQDYYRAGETPKAVDLLNESLTLSRTREQPVISAMSLFEIARIERDLGNFNNARNRIEEAIQVVESIRARITSQELRTTYFATVKRYYDFYIDLLMQAQKSQPEKGFDALALQTSEKARSRSLLDLLSQARIDIKQGIDPILLEREQNVKEKLIEKAYQQNRLLLGKHTPEEAEKIKAEVSNLTAEYEAVQSEIRNKSPRYAALTQPTSLNAKQIQQLLDSGTILLEYSLGEKKSYLWAVTKDSITSFDLPPREEIETRSRKVYELLTARNDRQTGETDAARTARIKAAEAEYGKAAAELSRILLAPAASQIGNKRLLIVADGALNYIPFSALPAPNGKENVAQAQPLGINHEIVTLPSASILALLREETQNRKPAPKMLAVFADPVFNRQDTRADSAADRNIKQTKQDIDELKNLSASRDFERAVLGVGLRSDENGGLPRLPFSRREADTIFKFAPKNLSIKQLDFDASKRTVFASGLEDYRILHFATHGLLNSRHPALSGVVLSLVSENGGDIDGFLRLQDIYNLKLSADLVVLSSCNSALGKDVKGEGLIGLTRGFMYAGSPRVIASLWKVDDAATAELMSIFYRKMLTENLRPAAALRAAQTEMMKQTRWKSPYYWAPFVIQGEWK